MITVITCTYNRRDLLTRAVRSVFEQKGSVPTEMVITDDGSTDGTKAHLEATFPAEIKSGRLRIFEYENCGDAGKGRNRGALHARGEYLAFLDSDDWWKSERLLAIEPLLGKKDLILEGTKAPRGWSDPLRLFLGTNWATTSSAVITRQLFKEIGGFPEGYYKTPWYKKLPGWEDYETWLRALLYLRSSEKLDRFELMTDHLVLYDPQPAGLGDVRIRRQMFREGMTLLRVFLQIPLSYWPLLGRRFLGVFRALVFG